MPPPPASAAPQSFEPIGRIVELGVRASGSAAPARTARLRAIAGVGLEADRHASPRSPRQVLLASCHAYGLLQLPPMALRENILVDCAVGGWASGDRLRFGAEVEMVAMFCCEPCGKLDRHRPGLSSQIGRERGVLARVTRGGMLHPGDEIRRLRAPHPLLSDDWRDRVRQVLHAVPAGCWVSYGRLAELAGVSAAYCRAFPRLLSAQPQPLQARAHPLDAARLHGPPWQGDGLHAALLQAHQADGLDAG